MSARDLGQPTILRDAAPLTCEEIAAISHGRARLAIGWVTGVVVSIVGMLASYIVGMSASGLGR